jgi:hypothetical protein
MENQLYIRVRGRVLGPYDQEKLQSLARRGQLSRMHQLSQDATNWVLASTYPELFISVDPTPAAVTQQPSGTVHEPGPRESQPPATAARQWWYRRNGSEAGPVDQVALQQMLVSGNLSADDLVWADGMSQWAPARQAPGLMPAQTVPWLPQGVGAPVAGAAERTDELPQSLCKSAANSRSWVQFIAIVAFVYAGLGIVGGILLLIKGANYHLPPVVAWGLFELIFAVDAAAGGFLLTNYSARLASLHHSTHVMVFEKGLDALRTFWIYVTINLIVILAFILVGVVSAVAVNGSIPW